jgi:hypothetical protein
MPPPARPHALEFPTCFRPWQACSISELGEVRPCAVYWRPMGTLVGHTFEQVWNGRKYRQLRRAVNEAPDSICHSCRLPQFDAEKNRAESQLLPGRKEMVVGLLQSIVTRKAKPSYIGVMDSDFDPRSTPPVS